MIHTSAEYELLPRIELPITVAGLTIDTLQCACALCQGRLVQLRGVITPWPTCYDFDLAGICPGCQIVVTVKFRWYGQDNRVTCLDARGAWREMRSRPPRRIDGRRVKTALRRLLQAAILPF